jgi:glutathione S-transferase
LLYHRTIADLSFVTWDMLVPWLFGDRMSELNLEQDYPAYNAWHEKLMARPSVAKIVSERQAAMAA